MADSTTSLHGILGKYESDMLAEWVNHQLAAVTLRRDLLKDDDLREQSRRFLSLFMEALKKSGADVQGSGWSDVREFLSEVSQSRARQGFTPTETATFVFSLKPPLFERLRRELVRSQRDREEVLARQQEMLELSTPVVELWQGILVLQLIGTLDSARTQIVMERLLQSWRRSRSRPMGG